MSLRQQAQWLVTIVFGALFAILMLVMHFGLMRTIQHIEGIEAQKALHNVEALLNRELENLLVSVNDYAGWDETYEFMRSRDEVFLTTNFSESTLDNLNVDSVICLDMQGATAASAYVSPSEQALLPVAAIGSAISSAVGRTSTGPGSRGYSGIATINGQLVLCAAGPILDSLASGPARGTLIMVRRIDEAELTRYTTILGSRLTLTEHSAGEHLSTHIHFESSRDSLVCHSVVAGLDGKPVMQVELQKKREFSRVASDYGLLIFTILLVSLALGGLLAGAAVERKLIQPLLRLQQEVAAVGSNGNLRGRVAEPEIIDLIPLASCFNEALEQIEAAQDKLRETQQDYHRVIQAVQEGIVSFDRRGQLSLVNPAFARIAGFAEEELAGRPVSSLLNQDSEVFEKLLEQLQAGETASCELRLFCGTGEYRDVLLHATPVLDSLARYGGALAVVTDITELKRAQQALASSQRLESLGVLAGGIAHDFNNLLAGIMGNAGLLADDVPEHSAASECLNDIIAASRRAADLTRQIQAYAGKARLEVQHFDVNTEIRQMARLINTALPKGVKLDIDLCPEPLYVHADQSQFGQIVMNLLINAAEAVDSHRGVVSIRTRPFRAALNELQSAHMDWQTAAGNYACISVNDNGCGMSELEQFKVFEPFYTTKFTGRGLGLAAVMGIIRSHQGALRLKSKPGVGSRFEVFLPLASQAESYAQQTAAPVEYSFEGKVLVVDDEPMVLGLAGSVLRRHGFAVVSAPEGSSAIEQFRLSPDEFSLVLLDMTMPGLNGAETMQELKSIRQDIPVLVCSGYSEQDVRMGFAGLTPEGFMQKPYLPSELLQKINATLRPQQAGLRV